MSRRSRAQTSGATPSDEVERVVAPLPFSTGLIDSYPTASSAIVIYAGSLAVARLVLTATWWYTSADPALIHDGVSPRQIRFHRINGFLVFVVFALSIQRFAGVLVQSEVKKALGFRF